MTKCLISFGANLSGPFGSPYETLLRVFQELILRGFVIERKSKPYSSLAFPNPTDPKFLNCCLKISVNCDALSLLNCLKSIEVKMGRQKNYRWSSRTCDLDLLSFGDEVRPNNEILGYWLRMPLREQIAQTPMQLLLPHPRIQDRAFILKPLLEIAAGWKHPILNLSVKELFDSLPKEQRDSVLLF